MMLESRKSKVKTFFKQNKKCLDVNTLLNKDKDLTDRHWKSGTIYDEGMTSRQNIEKSMSEDRCLKQNQGEQFEKG